ncbi:MAG: hypothetical protein DMG07_26155 [Acidobacteria bacterium]|nr:MAG: hypothetical protein DMG07_26155 [Acidobacteriota bacterium]
MGSYDGGLGGCAAPVFYNQQVWIYFNGTRYRYRPSPNSRPGVHDLTAISLATLPADRFMALIAGLHLGSLTTRPLVFAGSRLMLDMEGSVPVDFERAVAPAAAKKRSFDDAEVRVALLDQSGGPIEGFSLDRCEPLFRSGFQEVKWTGQSVARLAGKQVPPSSFRGSFVAPPSRSS